MNLIADQIAAAYLDIIKTDKARNPRVCDDDFVRIARIRDLVNEPAADVTAALIDLSLTGLVSLAPESNTKVLTDVDREAAVRHGSEALHLISFDPEYFED